MVAQWDIIRPGLGEGPDAVLAPARFVLHLGPSPVRYNSSFLLLFLSLFHPAASFTHSHTHKSLQSQHFNLSSPSFSTRSFQPFVFFHLIFMHLSIFILTKYFFHHNHVKYKKLYHFAKTSNLVLIPINFLYK